MKTIKEIVGLPVLSITEVITLGTVKDYVVNPEVGSVDYVVLEPAKWYQEARVISFPQITGIGEDALTIESSEVVTTISKDQKVLSLLEKEVKLTGNRVMTRKGRLAGTIDELMIEDESGNILGCRWVPADAAAARGYIPAAKVVTFGKELLVVADDFEQAVVENFTAESIQVSPEAEKPEPPEQPLQPEAEPAPTPGTDQVDTENEDVDPLKYFEEQQKAYLLGRKVSELITADDGEIIASPGETVTQEIIDRAIKADKFVELTLHTCE